MISTVHPKNNTIIQNHTKGFVRQRGIFLLLITFLSCKQSSNTLVQNQPLLPDMKNVNYMKNLRTGKFKPFSFIKTDSLDVSEFDKGIRYYNFKSNYLGEFSIGESNDTLYSKIGRIYSYIITYKGVYDISGYPFGGHLIKLQKVYFDEKHRDSVYIFNAKEIDTYDVEYLRNDSIEVKRISLSKKRGFLKLLIKEKSTNEIYLAQYYPELDKNN